MASFEVQYLDTFYINQLINRMCCLFVVFFYFYIQLNLFYYDS
jgi:hypothetical protein